jgi:hypothetical protein
MGKRSVQTMIPMARLGRSSNMIPMARLGRSNMIPMARLGRSHQGVVIPMARMGRSSTPGHSMIPMARLGRSAPEKEEMAPLYLPSSGVLDFKAKDILTNPEDLDTLMDILDEILGVIGSDKEKYPNLMKFIEDNSPAVDQDTNLVPMLKKIFDFTTVLQKNKLECLSLAKYFQSSLMFVSKVRACPSGAGLLLTLGEKRAID